MLLATAVYSKLWYARARRRRGRRSEAPPPVLPRSLRHGYDDEAHKIEVRCVDIVPICAAAVAVWVLLFTAFFLNPSYVWAALT